MANDMTPLVESGTFSLPQFFLGHSKAVGIFEDRFGRMRRRFEIDLVGRWDGAVFVLEERFLFDDGETERRTWTFVDKDNGRFTARSADCIGTADGQTRPDRIEMDYRFRLRLKTRSLNVAMQDRYYRMAPGRVLNRTRVTAFGVRIGEITAVFERQFAA